MKFQADFGAEDEARLSPCEDDKPKDAEITLFKAGSDYYLSAKYLGTSYVWGGASPEGFDCSGLVQYVAKENGIDVSRTSQEQYRNGKAVSKDELEPGDLVFFEGYTNSSTNPGHVGIYIGNGQYVQSPKTGDRMKVSKLSGRSDYVGARRISDNSAL